VLSPLSLSSVSPSSSLEPSNQFLRREWCKTGSTRSMDCSRLATASCPHAFASKSAVRLLLFSALMSAPQPSSTLTTDRCPKAAATDSGVAPSEVFLASILAPFSSSSLTTDLCPFWAAIQSGVFPNWSLDFTSMSAPFSSSSLTTASFTPRGG